MAAPSGGIARPASAAVTTTTPTGAPMRTTARTPTSPSAWATASATSTGRWPCASTSRARTGDARTLARPNAPVARPAAAKEPVRAWTSSSSARATIAKESRPSIAGRKTRSAPGSARTARYPVRAGGGVRAAVMRAPGPRSCPGPARTARASRSPRRRRRPGGGRSRRGARCRAGGPGPGRGSTCRSRP